MKYSKISANTESFVIHDLNVIRHCAFRKILFQGRFTSKNLILSKRPVTKNCPPSTLGSTKSYENFSFFGQITYNFDML